MRTIRTHRPETMLVRCPHCKSDLEVVFSDLHYVTFMSHYHGPAQSISCCVCGQRISLTMDELPESWQSKINEDRAEEDD